MLIRENLENYGKMTPQEMQEDIASHMQWVEKLVENGNFKGGNPLSPEGKCISGKDTIVTDGPYIETKEAISGYYFLLANSLEEVTEIAKGCPAIESGGILEIREIVTDE